MQALRETGKRNSVVICLFLLFALPGFSEAQQVSVTASFDSSGYRIGDDLKLSISVAHPFDTRVAWPDIKKRLGDQFQFVEESSLDSIHQSRFLTEYKSITVTTLDTGWLSFPPVTIFYQVSSTKWDSAKSSPLFAYVSMIPLDLSNGIKPIKQILESPEKDFTKLYFAGIIVLLTVLLVILLARRIRNIRMERMLKMKLIPPKSPYRLALDNLRHLEHEQLWEKGKLEEHYNRVTQILRQYIESALGVPALETTTSAIIRALKKKLGEDALLVSLKHDLLIADFVKFGKIHPRQGEHARIIKTVDEFIEKTNSAMHEKKAKH